MPRYRKGDRWSARDASYVWDRVQAETGYHERIGGSGAKIRFGKANGDIVPDTQTGSVIIWDSSVSPPVATTEQIDDVIFDWLSDQKISDGKEVAIAKVVGSNQWRILWAECETPSVSIYDDGGTPPATVTPGNTVRLPLAETPLVQNPSFTIVGGNSLQALVDVTLSYGVSSNLNYVASGNNQEIQIRGEIVTVSGTPTIIEVPLVDSFQTTRVGTFGRSHELPAGIASFTAGDIVAVEITNQAISTMDLDILGYFVRFGDA